MMQIMWAHVTAYETRNISTTNNGKLIEVGKWNANVPSTKEHNKNKTNKNDNLKNILYCKTGAYINTSKRKGKKCWNETEYNEARRAQECKEKSRRETAARKKQPSTDNRHPRYTAND